MDQTQLQEIQARWSGFSGEPMRWKKEDDCDDFAIDLLDKNRSVVTAECHDTAPDAFLNMYTTDATALSMSAADVRALLGYVEELEKRAERHKIYISTKSQNIEILQELIESQSAYIKTLEGELL